MAGVTADIATRFLGATEDIYIVRPGERFSLLDEFVSRNVVFLDFPALNLDLGVAKPKRQALREAVVRSMKLQEWYRDGQTGQEPSRNPQDYIGAANGRRLGRYVSAIERLYFDLPAGTIIVVPGPGYFSETRIAELVGPPTSVTIDAYPKEPILARTVRWIGKKPKASFSAELRERLQKPLLMMALDRSLREEILEAAYDQYSIGDIFSSRLSTHSEDFSTFDDYNIQTFLNYISGLLAAIEDQPDAESVDLDTALALLSKRRDLIPELALNINSPGDLRMFSSKIAPLVAAVMLAIALVVPTGVKPEDVQVINSAVAGGDPCALIVQQHALAAIQMMDLDTWNSVCMRVRDAAGATGLSTGITVVPDGAAGP